MPRPGMRRWSRRCTPRRLGNLPRDDGAVGVGTIPNVGWTTGLACVAAVVATACAHDADGALPEAPAPSEASAEAGDGEGDDERLYDEYVEAQADNLQSVVLAGVGEG